VQRLAAELVALRRDLHRQPELSWQERRTQEVVLERLQAWGLEDARPIADTGATALVRGIRPGRTLLWRADMDALPVQERNEVEYASTVPGVMHACGHDGHMAIALGLARLIHEGRGSLAGNVRFVFQPAEESAGGARRCIDAGILDEPAVDAALGLHIAADTPLGTIRPSMPSSRRRRWWWRSRRWSAAARTPAIPSCSPLAPLKEANGTTSSPSRCA
jgi:amidohydrolase